MSALDIEKERAEFEVWAKPLGYSLVRGLHTGDYLVSEAACAFEGWLAAKRAAQPAVVDEPAALMTNEQAEKWAWEQVRSEVGTDGWTVGDSCNYFGFFLWGWRYRAQYERQRRPVINAIAAHVSGQGGEDVRDAARYRLLRCYHISGSWPHEINPNPGILAFSTVKSARELDAMLDDRLAFTLPPNVDKLRPDYIEWRKSSTQAAIDAAIAAKESDSGSG